MSGPAQRRSALIRAVVLVLLVGFATAVALRIGLPAVAEIQAWVASLGPAAPALFVLGYAAATLAPLPKNILSAVAGLVFGLVAGIAIVLVAAVLGAIVAFVLGRTLGREAVQRFTGTRVARVDALLRRRGILAVIGVRLVPVVPFTAVNYAAGLTSVGVRDYVVGTAVGIVPGTVAYVALGVYGTEPDQWPFVAAVIVLLALSIGGAALARRARSR